MPEESLNRHERRRLRTRKALQEAAIKLLLESGYDSLTIQDITDTADLGRGTFYLHFNDKEDIIWSVIEEGILEEDRRAHEILSKDGIPERPFYEGLKNMFRHAENNRDLYRAMLGSHGSLVLINRVHDLLAKDLQKEMQIPAFNPAYDVPDAVAAQIVTGAIVRSVVWWLNSGSDYSVEEMAEMLYRVLWHRTASG